MKRNNSFNIYLLSKARGNRKTRSWLSEFNFNNQFLSVFCGSPRAFTNSEISFLRFKNLVEFPVIHRLLSLKTRLQFSKK